MSPQASAEDLEYDQGKPAMFSKSALHKEVAPHQPLSILHYGYSVQTTGHSLPAPIGEFVVKAYFE